MRIASTILVALVSVVSVGAANACTCPPYQDAADHASRFDFVALGHVEDVYRLEDPEMAVRYEYQQDYNDALTLYMLDKEAGDDTRTLREFEDAYEAENPPPPVGYNERGGTLTRLSVSKVLKGEDTSMVYIRSAPAGSPTCGMNYHPDTDIVILASGSDGKYGAWMCSIPVFSADAYEAALSEDAPDGGETTD